MAIGVEIGVHAATVLAWIAAAGHPRRPSAAQEQKRRAAATAAQEAPAPSAPSPTPPPPAVAARVPATIPTRQPPPLPTPPRAAADAQVAAAVAAGQVTRLPDPAIFARLPAITSADRARQELQRMGRTVQRSGGYWLVDGERRLTHVELSELATSALRDEAMRAAGATA